jgi:hypothetical protein
MRRLLLVITLVVFMCACKEKFETYYSSATAAAKAGEFDRDWLPDLLKPDVMDIRLWYDIDSNEVRGRFALNERVVRSLGSRCEPGMNVPRKSSSMPEWFPASITSGGSAAHGMQILHCDKFYVAIDTPAGVGYFWAN